MGNSLCTVVTSIRRERTRIRNPVRSRNTARQNKDYLNFTLVAKHIADNQSLANENCEMCVICLEDILEKQYTIKLPCGHLYHSDCLYRWLCKKPVCPLCSAPVKFDLNIGA
mgnify:CR=1 FL=1